MMGDPEELRMRLLLERAAENAGYKYRIEAGKVEVARSRKGVAEWIRWIPHLSDAESRRLQVRLAIHVEIWGRETSASCHRLKSWAWEQYSSYGGCCDRGKRIAVRMAVLRAAAKDGETC